MKSVVATSANAAQVLAVQVLALITLAPGHFGSFSILYLIFAFGSSLTLSIVSEAWIRADLRDGVRAPWSQYSSASTFVALAMGVIALGVGMVFEPFRDVAWLGATAVTAATYRSAARYYSVRVGEYRGVLPADLAGLVGGVALWLVLYLNGARDLWAMTLVWSVSALLSALLSKVPRILAPPSIATWVRQYRAQIRPLLRDSLLMDAGSIGTPYLLAPILGLANFGIYRAISNVAAPVRLVLNPIRPQLAATPIELQRSLRRAAVVVLISCLFGIAAYGGLAVVGAIDLYLGALTEIVRFAVPTGIFVAANCLGHYFYIVARAHLSGQRLLIGRIVQTGLALALPILGVLLWGLTGAVWGYVAATGVSALAWLVLVVRPEMSPRGWQSN